MISENGAAEVMNPNFVTWNRQDQLLFSFLLASMSESAQSQMIGCQTSSQLWTRVTQLFATRSKARVMQYKLQLQTLKKGNLSMKDYLGKMKGYIDILAACGNSIPEDDQILHILGGVGPEYESVVVHVTSRVESLSLSEVGALLLAHEGRIETYNITGGHTASPSVNVTTAPSQRKAENTSQSQPVYRGRGRGRNGRGGRKPWHNNGRPVCQICGIPGHVAEICYYRFDKEFVPKSSGVSRTSQQQFNRSSPSYPPSAFASTKSESASEEWWYPDSGASHHVTNDLGNLSVSSEYTGGSKVQVGNGAGLSISNIGESNLNMFPSSRPFLLKNLLHVPLITKNLISVSKFAYDNHVYFEFHPSFCLVKDPATHVVLLRGTLHNGLYRFNLKSRISGPLHSPACLQSSVSPIKVPDQSPLCLPQNTLDKWHLRLGHPSIATVKQVLLDCNERISKNDNISFCSSCQLGKNHLLPFPQSTTNFSAPFEVVYSDLWGPAHIPSRNGSRYYISFVDAYTRYTWIYFLKLKSEVTQTFINFQKYTELHFNAKIKTLQTDGGGEFRSLTAYCQSNGILHRFSCPYTSKQNGVVERKHRHVVDTGLSLLAHASLPFEFWEDAFFSAVYLINRLPSPSLGAKSPFFCLYGRRPDYSHLRVFGCLCFPCLRPYNTHKLAFRSTPCTFLGYSEHHKGYKCLHSSGRVYISRHVQFNE
ncbi:hypothetical protein F511_06348 [Dorcoceras hygrometricum]|uniref:Integrase catalytic domain-containing protein n=1 Tax=Dorcoceras hygrometricum TaxID=472368 RepID=A0A2Z7AWA7_9LAMI|nr:hypothetical protein F511_06348 [Dorcoceras hygrometricum]